MMATDLLTNKQEIAGATGVALAIPNATATGLEYIAMAGIDVNNRYSWLTLENQLGMRCYLGRQEMYIADLQNSPVRYGKEISDLANIRSIMIVPLLSAGDCLGIISFYSKTPDAFGFMQLHHVRMFASMIASLLKTEINIK
jgi:GAF domain-containing protein